MANLDKLRHQIDQIDDQIMKLLEELCSNSNTEEGGHLQWIWMQSNQLSQLSLQKSSLS